MIMAEDIIFTHDFLYHDAAHAPTYHWWAIDLLNPVIENAVHKRVKPLCQLTNRHGETFSRDQFYALSGITDQTLAYYHYEISKIKPASIDYLKSFIDEKTFVIGIELGLELKNILTALKIPFLNLWFHSWKLFDDAFFMFNTNDADVFRVLKKYQVPREKFVFYAHYWKIWTQQRNHHPDDDGLVPDCAVFIGQTLRDKSTDFNGRYLNILDYKDRLETLSHQYSKIYYLPHPYVEANQQIEEYINNTPYIQELKNMPTYQVLMSDKVKKVMGISSSVLYEAQFWDKEVEYLYKPLFNIDQKFEDDTFISIYQDYFRPVFWSEILAKFFQVNNQPINSCLFFDGENKFRNIKDLYYGYANYNEHKLLLARLSGEINNLKNRLNKEQARRKRFSWRLKKRLYRFLFFVTRNNSFKIKAIQMKERLKNAKRN